jgi:S-adenosylmethionine-dependent methyltransferase
MQSLIQRYYDLSATTEWARLERYRTEYAVTMRALQDTLPKPPGSILDCGGGPGRYAIELARLGYSVSLFDLSQISLSLARTNAHAANVSLAAYEHGSATNLSRFRDSSFDSVLLLGPLYHLTEAKDRELALQEVGRVLKPGGVLVAAFITRFAFLRYLIKEHPEQLSQRAPEIEVFFQTGVIPAPLKDGTEFIAHFITPAEVKPLVESAGFQISAILGVEGLSTLIDDKLNAVQGSDWEALVDLNYQLAKDPSLLGASDHLLCIAHK